MRAWLHTAFVAPSRSAVGTATRRTLWIAVAYALALAVAEASFRMTDAARIDAAAGGFLALTSAMVVAYTFVAASWHATGERREIAAAPAMPQDKRHVPAAFADVADESYLGAPERA
jgi:hypothetical protein